VIFSLLWIARRAKKATIIDSGRLRGRSGGLRTAARRVGWTQNRKTKDGVGRFRARYRQIRGQVQSARTFAKEREADKAVDVTRSVAYFHNANITQPTLVMLLWAAIAVGRVAIAWLRQPRAPRLGCV
jgi:hypothetical protein